MKKKEQIRRARAKARAQAERPGTPASEKYSEGGASRSDGAGRSGGPRGRRGPGSDAFKREQTVKTAKWNRYMLIRYLDAGLFFVGLYWLFMLQAFDSGLAVVAPILEIVLSLVVMVEAFTIVSRETEYLAWSRRALIASCAVSAVVLIGTIVGGETLFFPFFSGKTVAIVFCAVLIAVKLIIIHRIALVRDRRDKRYALYQNALKYNS